MSVAGSGADELDRRIGQLAAGVPEGRLREILRDAGEIVAAEARRIVPVDTGRLRDSIAVEDDRDARIYGKVNGGDVSVYVGPVGSTEDGDVFYARFVEFGTIHMDAEPFMRPALASKRPAAEKMIAAELATEIAKAAS